MKKFFAILMAAIMALSMVSFASADSAYDITLWVPEEMVDLTKTQIEAFNASNELGVTFNPTVEPVSEADSATSMITDVEAGADVFFFAQDQFARLVQAGALAKLDDETAAKVKAENDVSAVTAATSGDAMYAYPLTADNGRHSGRGCRLPGKADRGLRSCRKVFRVRDADFRLVPGFLLLRDGLRVRVEDG